MVYFIFTTEKLVIFGQLEVHNEFLGYWNDNWIFGTKQVCNTTVNFNHKDGFNLFKPRMGYFINIEFFIFTFVFFQIFNSKEVTILNVSK
jgi:hypothetical protein